VIISSRIRGAQRDNKQQDKRGKVTKSDCMAVS
jgi:hypothetical protein